MKKILLFAATAAAILCSCNKEQEGKSLEASALDGETPIVFDNYVNQTKSTTLDADSIKTRGFGVFAFSQEQAKLKEYSKTNFLPNFMYNQQVTYKDDPSTPVWVYSPVKYWPNNPGALVSFFAYAPYIKDLNKDEHTVTPDTVPYMQEVTPTNPEGIRLILGYEHNGPSLEYNVPSDPTKGVDLMWGADKSIISGDITCPCDKSKPGVNDKIQFQFKHALSRLDFDLQVLVDATDPATHTPLADSTSIKVKSVTLKGSFAKKGTLRLYDGTWNVSTDDIKNIVFEAGNGQFSDIVEDTITRSTASKKVPLLKCAKGYKNNYLMLIPKAKFNIEIVYDVTTKDKDNAKNTSTVTNTICSSEQYELKAGNAYTFHLVLGMTSAKFDADVTDWGVLASDEHNVDLPQNN